MAAGSVVYMDGTVIVGASDGVALAAGYVYMVVVGTSIIVGAGGDIHEPTFGIASVAAGLDDGTLSDPEIRAALSDWLRGFVEKLAD